MDSLIETIAAWPWWVVPTIYSVGAIAHGVVFEIMHGGTETGRILSGWAALWPIVTPIALPYLAIRRLVRWVRARRRPKPVEFQ